VNACLKFRKEVAAFFLFSKQVMGGYTPVKMKMD